MSMTGGRFSPTLTSLVMDQVYNMTIWIGLCEYDPFTVWPTPEVAEISSPSYGRVISSWTRTSSNVMTLADDVIIRGLQPGDVVAAVNGWDSQFTDISTGQMIFSDLLDIPITYTSGGVYVLEAQDYVIGMDIVGA
jgi:hypothetical protein